MRVLAWWVAAVLFGCMAAAQAAGPNAATQFRNPIRERGADPSLVRHGKDYYLAFSLGGIWVAKARTLDGLAEPEVQKQAWTPPGSGPGCCNVWAPELQRIGKRYYIYFAADDGRNENHRMYVLESAGDDPLGPYAFKGELKTPGDRWAIDGAVLQKKDALYFVWSGWEGETNVEQRLYIAAMSDPMTVTGERHEISRPDQAWERSVGNPFVNEGPQPLQHGGRSFIVYSANGSWSDAYCLGLLALEGDDPLVGPWRKSESCVFAQAPHAYGPGHNSFVKSPDGKEDWIVYHANYDSGTGWSGRDVRAQRFDWNSDGTPRFGRPADPDQPLRRPSGERSPRK